MEPFQDPDVDLDFADGDVRRRGNAIEVRSFDPVPCSGPSPTLANTEAVRVEQAGLSFNGLLLRGGPLWPGGSPEPDGSAETEVIFDAAADSLGYAEIEGTSRRESWSLALRDGVRGASLDPSRPHESDVLLEGAGIHVLVITLGKAGDRFRSSLDRRSAGKLVGIYQAGAGNDVMRLGSERVALADAGPGRDLVVGGPLKDAINGGPGKDRLEGGLGNDGIDALDGVSDLVLCGPDRDRARVDPKDRVRGCERVVRHRRGRVLSQ